MILQKLPENQCIFVRGFRVKRIFGKFHQIKAAAEPKLDPCEEDYEPEKEVIAIPSVSEVRLLTFDIPTLIYVFEVPGSSARNIRLYRESE